MENESEKKKIRGLVFHGNEVNLLVAAYFTLYVQYMFSIVRATYLRMD